MFFFLRSWCSDGQQGADRLSTLTIKSRRVAQAEGIPCRLMSCALHWYRRGRFKWAVTKLCLRPSNQIGADLSMLFNPTIEQLMVTRDPRAQWALYKRSCFALCTGKAGQDCSLPTYSDQVRSSVWQLVLTGGSKSQVGVDGTFVFDLQTREWAKVATKLRRRRFLVRPHEDSSRPSPGS
jgi:hypothetical protein